MSKILGVTVTWPKPRPFGKIIYALAWLSQDESMYKTWSPWLKQFWRHGSFARNFRGHV